jgi:hypothetical protein
VSCVTCAPPRRFAPQKLVDIPGGSKVTSSFKLSDKEDVIGFEVLTAVNMNIIRGRSVSVGTLVQQMWRLLRKINPSSRRRGDPISKHINGFGRNIN